MIQETIDLTKSSLEKLLGKKIQFVKVFPATGTFGAINDAQAFLKEKGYSVGSMQRNEPIGVAKGDAYISKWRNLGNDVKQLDGAIASKDFREGEVVILLTEELT